MTKHELIIRLLSSQGMQGTNLESFMIAKLMSLSPSEFVEDYNSVAKESRIDYLGGNMYQIIFK
jgi:hypothetical protein